MSKLRLTGSTSGFTELTAPAVAGSNTLTLPTGNGTAGQFLQTNGSGALSFAGAGKILQVVSATKTDSFSSSAAAFTDITGMSATLTPSSSSNKVLIIVSLIVSGDTWESGGVLINLVRDSTNLAQGTSGSTHNSSFGYNSWSNGQSNTQGNYASIAFNFLDSPGVATSTTYKLQGRNQGSPTYGFMVNRMFVGDALGFSSTITLLEVAA